MAAPGGLLSLRLGCLPVGPSMLALMRQRPASAMLSGWHKGSTSMIAMTGSTLGCCSWVAGQHFASHSQSHTSRVPGLRSSSVTVRALPSVYEVEATEEPDLEAATQASAPSAFHALGLNHDLCQGLASLGIVAPTEIQKLAIPAIRKGGDFLMTSHTGSGKTLAYLLPIVHALKLEESREGFVPKPRRPRAIVLGPTKELAEQITMVAKSLCHWAKFRVVCANAANRSRSQQESRLTGFIDVLVVSPTKLLQHIKEGNLYLRDVRWLVVDEADTMFAEGWGAELGELLKPLRAKEEPAHVVLVSATMTKPIQRLLSSQFSAITNLQTRSTHHAIAGSHHVFSVLPPGRDKLAMLDEVLNADAQRRLKTLVFCNSMDSCRAVDYHCRETNVRTVCYHGDMPVSARQESMKEFAGSNPDAAAGGKPLMIATDVAARGLDFSGHVDHVINFDFPYTAVDYIHRSGRTARAGRTGRITSLVSKRDKVLAQRIEWALEHNEPLDQLSSDPDVLPPSQKLATRPSSAPSRSRLAIRSPSSPSSRFDKRPSGSRSAAPPVARRGAARFGQERGEERGVRDSPRSPSRGLISGSGRGGAGSSGRGANSGRGAGGDRGGGWVRSSSSGRGAGGGRWATSSGRGATGSSGRGDEGGRGAGSDRGAGRGGRGEYSSGGRISSPGRGGQGQGRGGGRSQGRGGGGGRGGGRGSGSGGSRYRDE